MSTDITPRTSVSDERVGTLLADRYRLDAVVGTGGMATVYRATDESLGRRVAIKVFRPDLADADDIRRQREEIRLIASLSHPGVVTLFDAVADDAAGGAGRAFIVMQYVDGPDLRERLAQGPLGAATTALVGADLADALEYVHSHGVVHRDLKPANILVPSNSSTGPVAMLTDFGIARLVDGTRLTATGSVLGTASYLSPEQAVGAGLSPASDIYSLGLVLIESLTGERCFPGSALESAAARLSSDPPVPLEYGEEWASLLRRMTARRPEDRPGAGAVAVRLRAIALETAEISDPTLRLPVAAAAPSGPLHDDRTVAMEATAAPAVAAPASEAVTDRFAAAPLPASATIAAAPAPARRRRRRLSPALIAAMIAGALIVTAGGIWGVIASQPAPAPAQIEYPAVEGELGTSLEQLQESVTP